MTGDAGLVFIVRTWGAAVLRPYESRFPAAVNVTCCTGGASKWRLIGR